MNGPERLADVRSPARRWVSRLPRLAVDLVHGFVTPPILWKLPPRAGDAVGLTFDDGPQGGNTEEILRILRDEGVAATFFIEGLACERRPDLVRAIDAEGHQIANHSYSHLSPAEASVADYVADVERNQKLLQRTLGRPVPKLFRPPYGALTGATLFRLWRRGYSFALWSIDSHDSLLTEPDDVVSVMLNTPVAARDVILLHEDYDWTVQALPELIASIRERDLDFVTLAAERDLSKQQPEGSVAPEERCA